MKLEKEIQDVIRILKKSEQDLVFFNSLICPVRDLVGQSEGDKKMRAILDELEKRKIVEYYSGYWSCSETPGFFYADSLVLTKNFFLKECKGRPKQLTLF